MLEQIFALGADQARSERRCQEKRKGEETVKIGINQVALASSLELDLHRVRGAPGEGGSAGRPGTQGNRKRGPSRSPDLQDGIPWMKEEVTIWRIGALNEKERKNSQGKDPRTYEGNSQGRDPSTQERNSQGEDPRTLEESSEGGNVSARQTHSQKKDPRTSEAPSGGFRKAERKEPEKEEEGKGEKVEHRGSLWWTRRKEQFASLLVSERKEGNVKGKRQKEEQESLGEAIAVKI